jgi:hypothetical protein
MSPGVHPGRALSTAAFEAVEGVGFPSPLGLGGGSTDRTGRGWQEGGGGQRRGSGGAGSFIEDEADADNGEVVVWHLLTRVVEGLAIVVRVKVPVTVGGRGG